MSPRKSQAEGGGSIEDLQPSSVSWSLSESVRTQATLVFLADLEQENGKINRSTGSEMLHEVFDTLSLKTLKLTFCGSKIFHLIDML